jgi:hypothetical protein
MSAPGDYDNGEIGGMIGKGNRSTWRKPAPVPLCPPQTPHDARTRTRAAAVGYLLPYTGTLQNIYTFIKLGGLYVILGSHRDVCRDN